MKRDKGNQITPLQGAAIVASSLIGVGILTLPREVAAAAGTDGPLATLLGGAIAALLLVLLTKLGLRFPGHSLIEYSSIILGGIVGKLLALAFIIYWFLLTAALVRIFGEMVITAILTNTPLELIIGIMLLLGAQLAAQDVKVFARIHEILLPLTILPLLFLFLNSINAVNPLHLLPVFAFGPLPLVRGALATGLSFLGIEFILMLLPYYSEPQQAVKYHLYGILIPIILYFTIVTMGLGTFGDTALQYLQWPALEQIRLAALPSIPSVFERLESIFIGIWVVVIFTSVGSLYLMIILGSTQLLGLGSPRRNRFWHYVPTVPLFFLARLPQNIIAVETYTELISKAGTVLIVAGPGLLYLIALVRQKKGGGEGNP
ncbi:MAG: GerAB/ArcD/ProY family transporter [Firmicutes bacterium]|nr:GerAB/ArcD/ProY family transporter [Bacillota bacterium]